jgi:hypothetical protein
MALVAADRGRRSILTFRDIEQNRNTPKIGRVSDKYPEHVYSTKEELNDIRKINLYL